MRRVARSFAPYRRKVWVVACAIVFTSALGIANPLLIKQVNRLKAPAAAAPAAPTKACPLCTSQIPEKAIRSPQCPGDLVVAAH